MSGIASLLAGAAMLAFSVVAVPAATPAALPEAAPGEDLIVGSWALYSSRFLTPEGRIVDDANGDISHSEGQGYGMLMAVAANDRPAFERLRAWTRTELMIRGDRLAAWRWDPAAEPHVADRNDATDGDLLIAWALLRASKRWHVPTWRAEAKAIADDVLSKAVADSAFGRTLLPGVDGFREGEQPDGPVVNLSYWIFPAIEELAEVAPKLAALRIAENGMRLAAEARFGQAGLPADWTALADERPTPARKFPPQFGYNAVRVPLYLAWSKAPDRAVLAGMADALSAKAGGPRVVDLDTGATVAALDEPGYRAAVEVADCALGRIEKARVAPAFEPTHYYPSTLHILALMALAERYPQCLR